ncbi:MAG: ATP-binding protein [Nanoarchaeota archaeon]|nr:ATP-binding protein [Nanoarchaeota archaeon]
MSYYIIIRGPLGVGKSTISRKLAQILDGEYISIDAVLAEHDLDKVDENAECIPAENFIKADELILPEVRKSLKKSKIVIFDACFYHKEQIEHLTQRLPFPHYIFTLKAPLKICIERDSKRKKNYGEPAAAAVHSLVSRFDYGTIIDTNNKTVAQTVKEMLSYLTLHSKQD